jgi:hypothetical protein
MVVYSIELPLILQALKVSPVNEMADRAALFK